MVTLRAAVLPWSLSSRRAWIEIFECIEDACPGVVALLAEGVDRNSVSFVVVAVCFFGSPSSRRAWIEMPINSFQCSQSSRVALLAEGVDRN